MPSSRIAAEETLLPPREATVGHKPRSARRVSFQDETVQGIERGDRTSFEVGQNREEDEVACTAQDYHLCCHEADGPVPSKLTPMPRRSVTQTLIQAAKSLLPRSNPNIIAPDGRLIRRGSGQAWQKACEMVASGVAPDVQSCAFKFNEPRFKYDDAPQWCGHFSITSQAAAQAQQARRANSVINCGVNGYLDPSSCWARTAAELYSRRPRDLELELLLKSAPCDIETELMLKSLLEARLRIDHALEEAQFLRSMRSRSAWSDITSTTASDGEGCAHDEPLSRAARSEGDYAAAGAA